MTNTFTIDQYLDHAGITADQFAALAEITPQTLSRIRNGKQNTTIEVVRRIVAASNRMIGSDSIVHPGKFAPAGGQFQDREMVNGSGGETPPGRGGTGQPDATPPLARGTSSLPARQRGCGMIRRYLSFEHEKLAALFGYKIDCFCKWEFPSSTDVIRTPVIGCPVHQPKAGLACVHDDSYWLNGDVA